MSKDWKEYSDEDLLNAIAGSAEENARFDRIMQKKSIDSTNSLREGLSGLMETIHKASQGFQDKSDKLIDRYNKMSKSQSRQQVILITLSLVIAASTIVYTYITWQSVTAMRESNEIQREFLALEKAKSVKAPNQTIKPDEMAAGGSR